MTAACGRAHVRSAIARHDENFPIVTRLFPREFRDDIAAIYAFCRATDDLGDEAAGDRLALLDAWERDLVAAFVGERPGDPRLVALGRTVARRDLPLDPFLRLIEANRMDQRRSRWPTEDALLDYCRHSATPVGEMVLGVIGAADPWRVRLSDATCIGLQLVNFWQDIRRDLDARGRIYVPQEHAARFGVTEEDFRAPVASPALRELVRFEVDRARDWFRKGAPLAHVLPRRPGLAIRIFNEAGVSLCDAIARQGYDTLVARPAPARIGRARLVLSTLVRVAAAR